MTAGVGVYQFRKFGEDFHYFVGTLTAGGHHNHVGVSLLGDGVLKHRLAAAERTGNEAGTAFCNGVEGVYHADARFHDLVGTGLFLVALDSHLYGPFLDHGHLHFLSLPVLQHGNLRVYGVGSGFLDGFDGVFSLEGERHHDFVGQPAFLYLSQPVGRHYAVSGLGKGSEVPFLLPVQRVRVFTSLEKDVLHGGQVVLQAVINAGQQAGTQLDFQHAAFELHRVSSLEAAGALEHLDGGVVSVYLDDLCHHLDPLEVYVADFILRNRSVHLHGDQVTHNTGYNTFSLHILFLFFFVSLIIDA